MQTFPDVVAELEIDEKAVERLLVELESARQPPDRVLLARRLIAAGSAVEALKEEVLVPALEQLEGDGSLAGQVTESSRKVKDSLADLDGQLEGVSALDVHPVAGERFERSVALAASLLRSQRQWQARAIYPLLRAQISEERQRRLSQLVRRRRRLTPTHPHPRLRPAHRRNVLAKAATRMRDRWRDVGDWSVPTRATPEELDLGEGERHDT